MKKVIFTITLIFIIGAPFYSHAAPVTSQKKSVHQPVSFSKKPNQTKTKKKKNFLQRILIKKIQRKIDRKTRKRNKQKKGKLNRNANLSFFFGLLSLFAVVLGIIVIASSNSIGGGLLSFIIAAPIAIVFGVISLINSVKYFQRNNPSGQLDFEDFKAWFGIGVAVILVGILFALVFG